MNFVPDVLINKFCKDRQCQDNMWVFFFFFKLLLQVAKENVRGLWNPWVQLFWCEDAALITSLNQFFTTSSADVLEKLPPELSGEWTDFFIDGIYNVLLPLPISITGMSHSCLNELELSRSGLYRVATFLLSYWSKNRCLL